jgi:glyoxylate reductase
MTWRILSSRRFPGPAFEELPEVEILPAPLPDGISGKRPDIQALAVVHERVDDEVLDLLPDLRLVANYGAGIDGIDIDACRRRGVAVTSTPGVLDAAAADLTMGLIIACRRKIVEGDRWLRQGDWPTKAIDGFLGQDVSGATLGIIGFGRIGRAVARRARAFDMRVLYKSRTRLSDAEERDLAVEFREISNLVSDSDVITLHVPLTQETEGLFSDKYLTMMRDGACLINTARGAVVDERALVRHLVAGHISAGLDVFAHEPRLPRELTMLENVVLAPHMASATWSTRLAMTRLLVDNILSAASGRALLTPVNAETLR